MFENLDFSAIPRAPESVRYVGSLNLYQRLIQYFSAVADCGGTYLDIINFNRDVYPCVLSLADSEAIFNPEHGYACPDGSVEVGDLVRHYEAARIRRFNAWAGITGGCNMHSDRIAVGIGNGATGVMNCLLPAIRDYWDSRINAKQKTVVVTLPLYSVYDGIVTEHGLEPVYLQTTLATNFLPSASELEEKLRARPQAVILTFPTNPAQTTYGERDLAELQKIVELCQATETFLVIDNIYQDTLWNQGALNPEIFGLTQEPDFLVKIFSLSKDRPGLSGLRSGYWCGDQQLHERFFYYSSIQYNTPNSASRCMLALELLFRLLDVEERKLTSVDLKLLGDHLAGWNRHLDRAAIFARMDDTDLQTAYRIRLWQVEESQRRANRLLIEMIRGCEVFSEVINDHIGNVLLVRVAPSFFEGTDHELFLHLLRTTNIGVLPANAFGFPITPSEAWFRLTTIHNTEAHIAGQIETIAECLRSGRVRVLSAHAV